MGQAASGLPARGYSWPSFTEANLVALKPGNGAYSMQLRQERYVEVLPQIEADFPAAPRWWQESFTVTCVIEESLARALLTLGPVSEDEPRSRLLHDLRATTRLKLELLREIGMTPAAAAKVFRDAAAARQSVVDTAAIAERGRQAREDQERHAERAGQAALQ